MRSLAEGDLGPIISLVLQDRGIDLGKYKDRYLRRRLEVRLRASKADSLTHYLRLLHRDAGEYAAFISTMTVNTSSFFRNPECFRVLASHIIPAVALKADGPGRRPPFVWSVGCARGEEAYSLAILASSHANLVSSLRPSILATDIDQRVLEEAKEGEYALRSLSEVPESALGSCFERSGRRHRVSERLRSMVTFMRHDALFDPVPGKFLLVLCRNLIIYLEREAQEALMSRLADALCPGGYLVLGKSEILIGEARERLVPVFPGERIYQKVGPVETVSPGHVPRRRT